MHKAAFAVRGWMNLCGRGCPSVAGVVRRILSDSRRPISFGLNNHRGGKGTEKGGCQRRGVQRGVPKGGYRERGQAEVPNPPVPFLPVQNVPDCGPARLDGLCLPMPVRT